MRDIARDTVFRRRAAGRTARQPLSQFLAGGGQNARRRSRWPASKLLGARMAPPWLWSVSRLAAGRYELMTDCGAEPPTGMIAADFRVPPTTAAARQVNAATTVLRCFTTIGGGGGHGTPPIARTRRSSELGATVAQKPAASAARPSPPAQYQ